MRDAYEGTQIFGALGSGKTSGSGQALAHAFLAAGFGGLVLTAKPDERELWEGYARATGREQDLLIFSPTTGTGFNFLKYEMRRPGDGAGDTENIIRLFRYVLDVNQQGAGHKQEPYWENAVNQLLRNAIDIVKLATGEVNLQDIRDIIKSAPQYPAQLESSQWLENSVCMQMIRNAHQREGLTERETRDRAAACDYWLDEFPNLAEKTRSIIVSMFTSLADHFLRGQMFDMFCDKLTIVPEMSETGNIIILDLPVKTYGESGRLAQVLFKYLWQQAIERRNVKKSPRPVFLWADEAQNFCASYDMRFQATARSSRAATVFIVQNLPLYYASFGSGDKGKQETEALLGNLATKIFHANGDLVTNNFAADTIGKSWHTRTNTNTSHSENSGNSQSSTSAGTSQSYDYDILPRDFTTLANGGAHHRYIVEGILFKSGKSWAQTGKSHTRVKFKQI